MIVCADDYGLRDDVDRAILELSASGKLTAVSCMVSLERCQSETLSPLVALAPAIDVGLHLCLTDESLPVSRPAPGRNTAHPLPSYGKLVRQALCGILRKDDMIGHISSQYGLFLEKCGRRPDFIDGHLHVHQLPGIRDALVHFVSRLSPADRPYLRNTDVRVQELRERGLPWLKATLIGAFGWRLLRQLQQADLPTNAGFAGVYDFHQWRRYRGYLPRFISCLPHPTGILVVHPGYEEDWRRQEFEALKQFPFPEGFPNRYGHRTEATSP